MGVDSSSSQRSSMRSWMISSRTARAGRSCRGSSESSILRKTDRSRLQSCRPVLVVPNAISGSRLGSSSCTAARISGDRPTLGMWAQPLAAKCSATASMSVAAAAASAASCCDCNWSNLPMAWSNAARSSSASPSSNSFSWPCILPKASSEAASIRWTSSAPAAPCGVQAATKPSKACLKSSSGNLLASASHRTKAAPQLRKELARSSSSAASTRPPPEPGSSSAGGAIEEEPPGASSATGSSAPAFSEACRSKVSSIGMVGNRRRARRKRRRASACSSPAMSTNPSSTRIE
mmetsp:Transcript_79827/g.207562  ORF Transcript_79827/g.207562 Transcript_79827/m.207562 type:complete len:292 (-) Transcript_79827:431-1306(-)